MYNGAEFSVRNRSICASRGIFLSLTGAISVGLGNRVPLPHSTPILRAQIISQSVTDLFQHRRACPPQCYIRRGHHTPPRSNSMVFRAHCYKFLVEDLRPYTRRSTAAALTGIQRHCHFSRRFLW